MSLRILHVIASLDPVGGGPAEGVKQLGALMAEHNCVVEVATLDAPSAPWLEHFGLKTYALGPVRLACAWNRFSYSPKLKPWLIENVSRYDAVIVNGMWQYHGFCVRQILAKSRIPYFVFPHGMLDPWFRRRYPLKHLKKWLYWPWADYRVLRDARAVLFTCEEERRLARRSFWLYRCRERVIGYGTSRPTGDSNRQRDVFYGAFPALRDKRILLFISRLHPKKGCDILVEAFAKISAEHPTLHLVIAGPDQVGWESKLREVARLAGVCARITWAGMLTGDLKWGAYYAADAFILPSHQENFGIVVAEALACGVPVLISNKVNIWREVENERAGFVAEDDVVGTEKNLRAWLILSLADQALMRSRAVQCFERHFEMHRASHALYEVLS